MKDFMFFVTRGKNPDVVRYVRSVKNVWGVWYMVDYTVDHSMAVALNAE